MLVGVRFLFVGKEQHHEEGKSEKTAAAAYRKRDKRAHGAKHAKTEKSQRRGHAPKIRGVIGMTNKYDKNPNEQTDQMNLDIPQIDEEKTRFKMEKMMGKYKMLRLQTPEDFLPKITTTYTITPPSFSNQFHSTTEEAALKKMDWEIEREKYMKRIERGINRLTQKERRILVMLYMQDEEMYDYEIYAEMGLSQRNYYRVKNKAYYRLAFALREEVYKQVDKS